MATHLSEMTQDAIDVLALAQAQIVGSTPGPALLGARYMLVD
jgi:hypothetical protein